jgi:hypothetical protein
MAPQTMPMGAVPAAMQPGAASVQSTVPALTGAADAVGGTGGSFNSSAFWGGAAVGGALGSAASSIVGGFLQAGLIKKQAEIVEQRAQFNYKMANLHADKVIELGDETAREYMQGVSDLVGRQESTFAAQGVKVGVGVSAAIKQQTRAKANENILKIKNNAWNQAFGIKTGAMDLMSQAAFSKASAGLDSMRTILSGSTAATESLFRAAWTAKEMK